MLNQNRVVSNLRNVAISCVAGLALMGGMAGISLAATVPDVTGLTYDLASDALRDAGLSASTYRDNGSSVIVFVDTNWQVSAQDPVAGTEVDDGSSVSVNLTKLSAEEAEAALNAKIARSSESNEATADQGKPSLVIVTGNIIPDGKYSATLWTDGGEAPIVVAIEDGAVVAIEFPSDDAPAAEGAPVEGQAATEPAPEPELASEPEPEPEVSMGMKNAVRKAESYLRFMSFSREGLINQLLFEGFTEEEAAYGADNVGADWNEQAAAKAQSYLEFMSFSRDGLIDQLLYEGFSYEEAEYGVTAVGY